MANLQGKKISNTYEGLIKTENNSAVLGTTVLTDGAGNSLQVTVNTDGTLTAQTITAGNLNVSNWDEAYSWGDHSLYGYATSSDVANAVNDVINAAPTALDTLDELAAALGDDANFATTITNLITGVSDRVTVLENAGFITTDTNTQLSDADIAAMGYIKVDTNTQRTNAEIDARIALNPEGFITSYIDTNTQLSDADIAALGYVKTDTQLTDAEIAALGYIKTDTNTQRTDAEIDARIALNPEGFITSYVDTNTQLTDAEIAAMGYVKTDTNTQLSDSDIAAMGYIKTDTNTQRTDAEIDARIALNPEGFLTSETDSQTLTFTTATGDLTISNGNTVNIPDNNTQLSDADIAAFGYIKTDTNTQRTDSEINALIDANTNNFISDYTVTESDVTAHEGAITITESQISDLSHFSGSYNDLTDKPAGIVARSDEEIEDVIGAAISGSGATSVVYNDAAGTIVVSSTDTNTQLTDAEIAAFGYIKTDTNTQLTDAEIAAMGYIKVDTNTQLTDAEIAAFGYVKTDTQLTDSDIAAFGYIKTDTNTQRSDAEIQAIIDANSAGFITTYVDTNTQLSDADIAAMGYIKTDTNTQLSDSDIAAFGYIKTDTNTQRTDAEINALITTGISGLATETYVDNAVSGLVDSAPNTLNTLNELADALGDDPNFATTVSTNIGNVSSRVTTLENAGFITTDTNTQLSDADIAAFGYIKTDTNTQRTDAEIISVAETEGFTKDALPLAGGTLTGELSIASNQGKLNIGTISSTGSPKLRFSQSGGVVSSIEHSDTDDQLSINALYGDITLNNSTNGTETNKMIIKTSGNVGIGTPDPDAKLEIINDGGDATSLSNVQTYSGLTVKPYTSVDSKLTFSANSGNTQIIQATNNAGSTGRQIALQPFGGNVGIGTADPDAKLEISTSSAPILRLTSTDTSVNTGESIGKLEFKSNDVSTGGNNVMGFVDCLATNAGTTYALALGTGLAASATEKMRIDEQGDVGIGTTDPVAKLHVSGGDFLLAGDYRNFYIGGKTNNSEDGLRMSIDNSGNSYFDHRGAGDLNFRADSSTGGTTRMTIESGGNVGISETSPDTFLHVTKNALSHSWTANSNNIATFENSASAQVNIVSGGSHQGELWFSDATAQGRGRLRYDHSSDEMEIWVSSGKKVSVDGAGDMLITGNLTENSDASLKENVVTIENALDKVNSLRGVEYNMIADEGKTKKIGFIAQEMEGVIPELVSEKDGIKSVAYSNTVALLVESIKELTDKVSDLQGQIDAMRA